MCEYVERQAAQHSMHGCWGLPSAHALGLGDPVKLDEQCSLEAHSPKPHLTLAPGASVRTFHTES